MSTSRATVLIVGGTGIIGSNLTGKLADLGYKVIVHSASPRFAFREAIKEESVRNVYLIAGDINDRRTLRELVEKSDVVFHKAASTGLSGAVENTGDYVQANMAGIANLVDALRSSKNKVKKVIFGSSISVYGEGVYNCDGCGTVRPELRYRGNFPAAREGSWDPMCPRCGGPIAPVATPEDAERKGESIYAVIKKAQEDMLVGTCHLLNMSLFSLRYATVIGAGQSWHNPFTRFLEMMVTGAVPELNEDGRQTRDFVFVDDIARANILALESTREGIFHFNVGSGEPVALMPFSTMLSEALADRLSMPVVGPRVSGNFVAGDVRHCFADCGKIEQSLGFRVACDLHQGVEELVDWFVRHRELATTAR